MGMVYINESIIVTTVKNGYRDTLFHGDTYLGSWYPFSKRYAYVDREENGTNGDAKSVKDAILKLISYHANHA